MRDQERTEYVITIDWDSADIDSEEAKIVARSVV
jgi:hypothetical protein